MVVTCPSVSDIITPAYPITSRLTRAITYERVERNANSLTNSPCVQGVGYTWASIRSTDRRWRRRIGEMCTSSGSVSLRAVATSSVLSVPTELGIALAQVHG